MTSKTVKVLVPGTTANCGPGFDSVGIACNIYNELTLTLWEEERLEIEVAGEGKFYIPTDEKNIVWKSIQTLLEQAHAPYKGASIQMMNRIPLARGLGSSAAAIVGGLTAANALLETPFDRHEILQFATEIEGHPDNVAPAIFGGVTISITNEGRAECLHFIPEISPKLVVAVPGFNLSTKAARKVLPAAVSMRDAVFNVGRAALFVGALCKGELQHLKNALDDRLHQPYRCKLVPGMQDVFAAAVSEGALGAALSGAGPCLIAFAVKRTDEIGEAMVKAFQKNQVEAKYFVLGIEEQGARAMLVK